jgi:hypothetical protein
VGTKAVNALSNYFKVASVREEKSKKLNLKEVSLLKNTKKKVLTRIMVLW